MRLLIILLSIPAYTFSQSGLEILQSSAQKIKNLKNISYNIYTENRMEKVTADVTIQRDRDFPVFEVARIKVAGLAINDQGSKQISFSYNGKNFDFIDLKTSEITTLDSPTYNKIGRVGFMMYADLAMSPYWQKDPFSVLFNQLKNADKLNDTLIYGVPCYQVKITGEVNSEIAGKQKIESTWFIDKEKYMVCGLVTRFERKFLKIRSVDGSIDQNSFKLASSTDVKKITGREPIGEGLLKVGSQAPDWSLPSSQNKVINLKDLRGKIVLLDFWGTWCVPCLKAMPDIQKIHDQFKGEDVEVIGVSVETEKGADPLGYFSRKGYTYTTVVDGNKITAAYKVIIFPTVYILDKNGSIIHAEFGSNRENFLEDLKTRIRKALKG